MMGKSKDEGGRLKGVRLNNEARNYTSTLISPSSTVTR